MRKIDVVLLVTVLVLTLFGLLMILMMIFRPQGILGSQLIRRELKRRPHEGTDADT